MGVGYFVVDPSSSRLRLMLKLLMTKDFQLLTLKKLSLNGNKPGATEVVKNVFRPSLENMRR